MQHHAEDRCGDEERNNCPRKTAEDRQSIGKRIIAEVDEGAWQCVYGACSDKHVSDAPEHCQCPERGNQRR